MRALAPQLQGINKAPVFVWQGSSKVQIFSDMAGKEVDMTYYPSISVQPITRQFLRDRLQTMSQLFDKGKSDSDQTIKDVSDKLDDLTANLNRETSELNKKQIKRLMHEDPVALNIVTR